MGSLHSHTDDGGGDRCECDRINTIPMCGWNFPIDISSHSNHTHSHTHTPRERESDKIIITMINGNRRQRQIRRAMAMKLWSKKKEIALCFIYWAIHSKNVLFALRSALSSLLSMGICFVQWMDILVLCLWASMCVRSVQLIATYTMVCGHCITADDDNSRNKQKTFQTSNIYGQCA